jgi:integrase/recombinase XerD
MNRRSSSTQLLEQSIKGFLYFKSAEGLTDRSLESYQRTLSQWAAHTGAVKITQITSREIFTYLNYLRTEYIPHRFSGEIRALSPKTIRNVWITLSSFFHWASKEYQLTNPMRNVPPPRFQTAPVSSFTEDEVRRMLKACINTKEADTNQRRRFVMRRPTANRDQAIILVLLDSGLRASELCSLKIGEIDIKRGKLEIKHGVEGGAKGGKGRIVFLGKITRQAVYRSLPEREDMEDPDAPLFTVSRNRPFNPATLRHIIKSIAERAGVKNAYPHKFRHTFAITYLRSGGDVFTLQALLGHSSLDMVRHYAQIAQIDIEQTHRKASPVDNWRL